MWIAHHTKFLAYDEDGGGMFDQKRIDRDLYEYIAEYILDDTVAVLKALTNEELVVLLNTFYRVDAGSDYSTVLSELAMAKTTKFNRDDIDKYAAIF